MPARIRLSVIFPTDIAADLETMATICSLGAV
jgi:hypothetical protein